MINDNPLLNHENTETAVNRRGFLKWAGGLGISAAAAPTLIIPRKMWVGKDTPPHALIPSNKSQELFLSFYNRHTGESLKKCIFWAEGKYNSEGLKDINKLFRDHRTQDIHDIDHHLLHILHKIQRRLETTEPFHLISGYRSPKSNKMLNTRSRGVAKNSQHVYGKAADIYVPGRSLKQVQFAAKSLQAGGVGKYSEFVHVDTGRVRYWGLA